MSSSSKLSFQSGDSPSARRKSWPGFHGLKALGLKRGAGSRNIPTFPLLVSASAQSREACPSRWAGTRVAERLPDAPCKRPASPPPPHIPSLLLPDAQEDSSLQSLESARLLRVLPGHCQLRDPLSMWGMALLWSAGEQSHTAKPLQH